jgi:2-polyprenyl-3-methyl-5-hydroxy-6-metoxy-1,4-benzoquinol methylase
MLGVKEMPSCYLCGSRDVSMLHPRCRDTDKVQVLRCGGCGLVFLSDNRQVAGDFYERSGMYDFNAPDPRALDDEERADTERRELFLRERVKGRAYLDVGCGAAAVAARMKPVAAKVAVVEPNESLRKYIGGELGIEAFPRIERIQGRYDVISLFHVLEHLESPRDALASLARSLTAGGEILVEVPNADDALITLYEVPEFKDFTYWSCHLFLFNETTLRALAEQAGLTCERVEQVQRYPLANHLHWMSRRKPGGHKHWAHLRDETLERAYAAVLARQGRCDTLIATLRTFRG